MDPWAGRRREPMAEKLDVVCSGTVDLGLLGKVRRRDADFRAAPSVVGSLASVKIEVCRYRRMRLPPGAPGGVCLIDCFGWIEEKSPLKNQWDMA